MTKEELEKTIDFDDAIHRIVRLEKENADLKCECRRCVYTDCPCILSDFGKDRNGICDHFKDVFDENVELREQLNKNPYVCNTEWHCNDCLEQLTKAKELLTRFVMASVYFNGKEKELVEEAEQFLKETEQ